MSSGTNLLFSIIKSGNKHFLNRIREDHLKDSASGQSEIKILKLIREHVLRYRALPTPEVLKQQGVNYEDTTQPVEYYLDELKKRTVYDSYKNFRAKFDPHVMGVMNMDAAVEEIAAFSQKISQIAVSEKYKSIQELGKDIEAELDNRRNGNPTVFVPFGWPTLDALTGGASGGDLCYFVARPGKGKSQLLTHMSHHAWTQGFSPLVLTMEMTDMQIARRIYGIKGQFNHDVLRRGDVSEEVDNKLGSAIKAFEDGPDFNVVCGQVRQTVESITSLVDELQPDILYVDAAYLLNLKGSTAKMFEKLAQVGERLKELAVSRNIPIILTVQFNRDAAKTDKFELENIAGSDTIGQLGSVVVAIKSPEGQYEETRRVLEIIKNREGGMGEFEINFQFNPPTFTEITQQNLPEILHLD